MRKGARGKAPHAPNESQLQPKRRQARTPAGTDSLQNARSAPNSLQPQSQKTEDEGTRRVSL